MAQTLRLGKDANAASTVVARKLSAAILGTSPEFNSKSRTSTMTAVGNSAEDGSTPLLLNNSAGYGTNSMNQSLSLTMQVLRDDDVSGVTGTIVGSVTVKLQISCNGVFDAGLTKQAVESLNGVLAYDNSGTAYDAFSAMGNRVLILQARE